MIQSTDSNDTKSELPKYGIIGKELAGSNRTVSVSRRYKITFMSDLILDVRDR